MVDKEKANVEYVFELLKYDAYDNAIKHGFYKEDDAIQNVLTSIVGPDSICANKHRTEMLVARLGLVGSEVGEAIRAVQHADYNNLKEELADICIRIFDICGWQDINIGAEILDKMEKNSNRPYQHNKII